MVKNILQVFDANWDTATPVTNHLPTPVIATYIRLYQEEVAIGGGVLRMEVVGCDVGEDDPKESGESIF